MRSLVHEAGLQEAHRAGQRRDGRMACGRIARRSCHEEAAGRRGIVLEGARPGRCRPRDFEELEPDPRDGHQNLSDLQRIAPDEQAREKVRLLREWGRAGCRIKQEDLDVPDPYYRRAWRLRGGAGPGAGRVTALLEQLREGDGTADSAVSARRRKTAPSP